MMTASQLQDVVGMMEQLNDIEANSNEFIFEGTLSIVAPGDSMRVVGKTYTSDEGFKFRTV